MTVLTLHKPAPADDIVRTLRLIADDIEAGKVEWPVTTAVLILGHTGVDRPEGDDERWQEMFWRTYGVGPRSDAFTVRGLLATAIHHWGHD